MRQSFLKDSYNLGWGSADYRVGLGGQGETTFDTISQSGRTVVPIDGTFSNLQVYAPAGQHPNFTVIMFVNNVATALSCVLLGSESIASDRTHTVSVVAGDDIRFSVNVNPFGAGVGYPMNLSIEFEGAQQWYGLTSLASGSIAIGARASGGALGNGGFQIVTGAGQVSNSYSICSTPGIITGIRMKSFIGAQGPGNGFIGYITKGGVIQDGTGGTVNTACNLLDAAVQATSTFSLPIAVGDRIDVACVRVGSILPFTRESVCMSCSFTPTNPRSFMCTGGSNNANVSGVEYRWMHSQQLIASHEIVKCPVGPAGIIVNGLHVEVDAQHPTGGLIFTITKNGIDTAATCTVPPLGTSATISGLSIPFSDGDFIALKSSLLGSGGFIGNGCFWGLAMLLSFNRSGIYEVKPGTRDKYYSDEEKKIPDPTIRTAIVGE